MDTPERDNVGSLLYLPLFRNYFKLFDMSGSNLALFYCNASQALILFPVLEFYVDIVH